MNFSRMLFFRRIRQRLVDLCLPPSCLSCGKAVVTSDAMCSECFKQLSFLIQPYCKSCGMPFASQKESGASHLCLTCSDAKFPWSQYYAPFIYNEVIKKLILGLKYNDQQNAVCFFANMMLNIIGRDIQKIDYIIPVPLHKKRLRQRKYNQSALLASQLAKKVNVTVLPDALLRMTHTPMLGHFSRDERQVYLMNAFCMNPYYHNTLFHKKILLIDDVMTTGTTLSLCARILYNIGVKNVSVMTIAKVM